MCDRRNTHAQVTLQLLGVIVDILKLACVRNGDGGYSHKVGTACELVEVLAHLRQDLPQVLATPRSVLVKPAITRLLCKFSQV